MKLVAKKINRTDFAPYGTYYSMYDADRRRASAIPGEIPMRIT